MKDSPIIDDDIEKDEHCITINDTNIYNWSSFYFYNKNVTDTLTYISQTKYDNHHSLEADSFSLVINENLEYEIYLSIERPEESFNAIKLEYHDKGVLNYNESTPYLLNSSFKKDVHYSFASNEEKTSATISRVLFCNTSVLNYAIALNETDSISLFFNHPF